MASPFVEIQVGDRVVKVTNPGRVYFPERGETKRDLVGYYLAVGDGILRALRDRPTTLERWPGGVVEGARLSTRADNRGDAFYQKRVPKNAPEWIGTARITFPSGRHADEICPRELAAVAWAANLGTVTFHPWPVRCGDVDHPDELRIDLDPQPGTDFADAKRVALGPVREILDELGMIGYPKTSGGRGVHVYVRIEPRWTFTEVRRCALAFGREAERRMPGMVTTNWWKEERGRKVFVDFNQNARDRTIASAYSVRPKPHAPVSAPVTWEELPGVEPGDFTIATMPARFADLGDVHAAIDERAYSLATLLEWADRDERDHGLGDMPYPPNYPKMAGEPKRVQPSKARRTLSLGRRRDVVDGASSVRPGAEPAIPTATSRAHSLRPPSPSTRPPHDPTRAATARSRLSVSHRVSPAAIRARSAPVASSMPVAGADRAGRGSW